MERTAQAAGTAPTAVEATRWLAAGSTLGLIAAVLAWELALAPQPSGLWAAIKALPLCAPVAGLLRRRMYTYRWTSLLVWFYVASGVLVATTPNSAAALPMGVAQVVLALALFAACALHVRLRLRNKGPDSP